MTAYEDTGMKKKNRQVASALAPNDMNKTGKKREITYSCIIWPQKSGETAT